MRQPSVPDPICWRESNHRAKGQDYGRGRDLVRGAIADTRGARGRARAVRDAARSGAAVSEAVLAGLQPVHAGQIELFPSVNPVATGPGPGSAQRTGTRRLPFGRYQVVGVVASSEVDPCPDPADSSKRG
jgi:hypothetical protein